MTNHPRSPRHRLSCWWNNICPLHGEVHYGSRYGFPDKYLKCSGCRKGGDGEMKIWSCKIGEVVDGKVPMGGDGPMRKAVGEAYMKLTGEAPTFLFSGWGAELDEYERAALQPQVEFPSKRCTGKITTGVGGSEETDTV